MYACISLAAWQLISTAVLGLLTIGTYFLISRLSRRSNTFFRLDDELNNIVNTWVKYPLLEDNNFINAYHVQKLDKEDALRYDAYCTLNFNFIESLYKHFDGNKRKMRGYCEYEEIIKSHKEWWSKNQNDALTQYRGEFGHFVDTVIKDNHNS